MRMGLRQSGRLGELWVDLLIVLAAIVLVLFVALPRFVFRSRASSSKNACIANLKQIEGAKATWALEHRKLPTDTPLTNDLYGPTNYIREAPTCPDGGIYTIGRAGAKPMCSLGPRQPGHSL